MYQQATPTLFSVHLIDRSRNCACDCKTIQHKHSLIRICSKEARTQTSSPTSPRTPLADSFCGQTTVASGNQLYQTTSAPGIPSCSSPSSAFQEEKVACAPWDSTTRGVPISDLCPSYLPVSPHFPGEEDLIQPETTSPFNTSSLGTSKPFHQRCRGLLRRVKEKTRLPFRIPHGRHRSTSHPPAEMDGQESGIHELPDSYGDGRFFRSHLNNQLASQPYGCDYAITELFGVGSSFPAELPTEQNTDRSGGFCGTRMSNSPSGLVLGGANDFSSAGPYELCVPRAQDRVSMTPQENTQPQLNFMAAQPPSFSELSPVSNPTHPSQNIKSRSPHLPALTVRTANISSRRPSWQSSISSSVPSQFTGTTPSSGTRITPFSPTQPSFGTPSSLHPPSTLNLSGAYLGHNKNGSSPEEAMPYKNSNDSVLTHGLFSMRDLERLEDLLADPRRIQFNPSPTINHNLQFPSFQNPFGNPTQADVVELDPPALNLRGSQPPARSAHPTQPHPPPSQHLQPSHQPEASPPRVLQARSPRPQASCDNRCPRCYHVFTSKPRDVTRNIRRHLQLSCPNRDANVPRLSCSVLGCRKTFVRDCAKRVHEEKQHGILRSSRRGGGAAEGLPMRRALSAV